jgi:hypothetical protein
LQIATLVFEGLIIIGWVEPRVIRIVHTAEVHIMDTVGTTRTPETPEDLALALVAALVRPGFRDY